MDTHTAATDGIAALLEDGISDADMIAAAAVTAVLRDRGASLGIVRAAASMWGEIDVDHAEDPAAAGEHYLQVTFSLDTHRATH